MAQVMLIEIVGFSEDIGCFVNGTEILTADPDLGESRYQVISVAQQLSVALDVEVQRERYAPKDACWEWDDVTADLITRGRMTIKAARADG
ncbi:hypothetical protein [Marinobacter salicampi]|uniref:hypothetical protein n=1 Tax=Marinobacter salicampi TaxID=435907 RepID=UPI00140D0A97|nr:hypothetical protein [Marinobacter salicampi]